MRISDWSSDVCSSDLSIRAPVKSRAPSRGPISVIRCDGVEIHRSARRHGVSDADILHPVDHPLVVVDVDPDADPPKVLVIGPDLSSNLLELFVLELADDRLLTIHAMPLRRSFHDLLPKPE